MVKNLKIIACEAVIKEIMAFKPPDIPYTVVESGLHLSPDRLKRFLQESVDQADGLFDTIVLGFGLCGNAVLGISAKKSSLVIPRVDDCNAIFLGSPAIYKDMLLQSPGTYFLSRGWIESGSTLIHELEELEKRHGRERALWVREKMLKHYTRLVFVETGGADMKKFKTYSRKAASTLGLDYEEVKGNPQLIQKMMGGPHTSEFIIARPGHEIRLGDFISPNPGQTLPGE